MEEEGEADYAELSSKQIAIIALCTIVLLAAIFPSVSFLCGIGIFCNFRLTLTASPATEGTVSPVTGYYTPGPVSIQATSESGYAFSMWEGTGTGSYTGTNSTASVEMNGDIQETAIFTPLIVTTTSLPCYDAAGTWTCTGTNPLCGNLQQTCGTCVSGTSGSADCTTCPSTCKYGCAAGSATCSPAPACPSYCLYGCVNDTVICSSGPTCPSSCAYGCVPGTLSCNPPPGNCNPACTAPDICCTCQGQTTGTCTTSATCSSICKTGT